MSFLLHCVLHSILVLHVQKEKGIHVSRWLRCENDVWLAAHSQKEVRIRTAKSCSPCWQASPGKRDALCQTEPLSTVHSAVAWCTTSWKVIIQAAGNSEVSKHREESCCDVKVTDVMDGSEANIVSRKESGTAWILVELDLVVVSHSAQCMEASLYMENS